MSSAKGEKGAAIAGALIGAISGNTYDQRTASSAWESAGNKEKVIKEFGSRISVLQKWYVDGLVRLGVQVDISEDSSSSSSSQSSGSWYQTGWLWVALICFWPLGLYGIYKRYLS